MSAGWAGFHVNPFSFLTCYRLNLWFGDTSDRKGPATSTGGIGGGGSSSQQKNKWYRGRRHPHLSRLRVWATQTLDIKSSCKCCQGTLYLQISGIFFLNAGIQLSLTAMSQEMFTAPVDGGARGALLDILGLHTWSQMHTASPSLGAEQPYLVFLGSLVWVRGRGHGARSSCTEALRRKCCCKRLSHLPERLRQGAEAAPQEKGWPQKHIHFNEEAVLG